MKINKSINDRTAGENYLQEQRFKFSYEIPQHLLGGSGKGNKHNLIFAQLLILFS